MSLPVLGATAVMTLRFYLPGSRGRMTGQPGLQCALAEPVLGSQLLNREGTRVDDR